MDSSVNGALPAVVAAFVVQAAFTAAMFAWGRWVARRQGGAQWAKAAWLPVWAGGFWVVGLVGTIAGLVRAFGGVSSLPAEHKARVLADGISTAMWATALMGAPSAGLYLAAIAVFAVGSLRTATPTRKS